jgi:hypothetical protein
MLVVYFAAHEPVLMVEDCYGGRLENDNSS